MVVALCIHLVTNQARLSPARPCFFTLNRWWSYAKKNKASQSGSVKKLKLAAGTGMASNDPNNQTVYKFTTRRWNGTTYTGERNPKGVVGVTVNVQLPPEKKSASGLESIVAHDTDALPEVPVPTPPVPSPVPIPAPLPGSGDGSVVTITASELDIDYLVQEIVSAAAKTETGEVIIFVHGYNNRFEVSASTSAHIARTLNRIVVELDWNSKASCCPMRRMKPVSCTAALPKERLRCLMLSLPPSSSFHL